MREEDDGRGTVAEVCHRGVVVAQNVMKVVRW